MKIIIVEPHPYHYEVVAGLIKYFIDMQYDVTIMVRNNFDSNDVLCRLKDIKILSIIKYNSDKELKSKLLDESMKQYDFIFFSSMEYFHEGKKDRIIEFLGEIPKTKYGFLGIYHNLNMISDSEIKYLKEGRIFSLSEFNYKGIDAKILSAHLFGNVNTHININKKKKILLIGLSNRRMLIENAVERMLENDEFDDLEIEVVGNLKWQRDIVKRFISNIVYFICKKSKLKTPYERCTLRSWKRVKMVGPMKFKDMFELIEASDFIGIILDPNDYQSKPFLDKKTSGSKQLAYGFNKPVLINDRFAKAYGFNFNNSIIYKENDIYEALTKIRDLSDQEYEGMVLNIKDDAETLYRKSLENLNESLRILKG